MSFNKTQTANAAYYLCKTDKRTSLPQVDYSSLVDVRMIEHGNVESANAVTSNGILPNPTKATKRGTEKLITDQAAEQGFHQHKESEGHTPAKGKA